MMLNSQHQIENEPMHHREITLPDGRYMIFYTFGESETTASVGGTTAQSKNAVIDQVATQESGAEDKNV